MGNIAVSSSAQSFVTKRKLSEAQAKMPVEQYFSHNAWDSVLKGIETTSRILEDFGSEQITGFTPFHPEDYPLDNANPK